MRWATARMSPRAIASRKGKGGWAGMREGALQLRDGLSSRPWAYRSPPLLRLRLTRLPAQAGARAGAEVVCGRREPDQRQVLSGAALAYRRPEPRRGPHRSRRSRSLVSGESPALVHGYCLQRRPDARPQGCSVHNPGTLRHIALTLIRMNPIKRKSGIKSIRLIAAAGNNFRARLLGPA